MSRKEVPKHMHGYRCEGGQGDKTRKSYLFIFLLVGFLRQGLRGSP